MGFFRNLKELLKHWRLITGKDELHQEPIPSTTPGMRMIIRMAARRAKITARIMRRGGQREDTDDKLG